MVSIEEEQEEKGYYECEKCLFNSREAEAETENLCPNCETEMSFVEDLLNDDEDDEDDEEF